MVRAKICGIKSLSDANFALDAGADAVGFIFVPHSKRYISPDEAQKISERITPLMWRIGVFANLSPAEVRDIASYSRLTAIQLHGSEDPLAYCHLGLPVIKAIKIPTTVNDVSRAQTHSLGSDPTKGEQKPLKESFEEQINLLRGWAGKVQGVLLDSEANGQFGGTGRRLPSDDYTRLLASEIKSLGFTLIIAGGLTPGNVQEVIRQFSPDMVDVSSGVEHEGKKDQGLIRDFINAVRTTQTLQPN